MGTAIDVVEIMLKPLESPYVFVGMSGGVDSAVTAHVVHVAGHRTRGVFMKNWSDSVDEMGRCAWRAERRDAMRVAALLGISFTTYDFEEQYRAAVGEYLFTEYAAGRTPNPDIVCNQQVKLPLFWERARTEGATMIATGHYAQRALDPETGLWQLRQGADPTKDQSYFLYTMTQELLAHTLFPVGHMLKTEVRALAKQLGLPVAEKKDSTGICFIGEVNMKEFLQQRIPKKRGEIKDTAGALVGHHDGVWFFTIGQRHGLEIGGARLPLYVAKKDITTNTLIVAHEHEQSWLYGEELTFSRASWIAGSPPQLGSVGLPVSTKIRYRQPHQDAVLYGEGDGRFRIRFARPQRAITPGQSAVIYVGDVCLGGGIIE